MKNLFLISIVSLCLSCCKKAEFKQGDPYIMIDGEEYPVEEAQMYHPNEGDTDRKPMMRMYAARWPVKISLSLHSKGDSWFIDSLKVDRVINEKSVSKTYFHRDASGVPIAVEILKEGKGLKSKSTISLFSLDQNATVGLWFKFYFKEK